MNEYKMRLLLLLAVFLIPLAYAEKVNFSEQIRPFFNQKCTGCHGGVKEAGGLSLLYKERAFGKTNHGIGIVPGKPLESMIYKVITNPPEIFDKKKGKKRHLEKMPLEKKPLTTAEVALIKKWIEEGANWEEHWAYDKITKSSLPKVSSEKWLTNYIDSFILAQIDKKGFTPTKAASKGEILRRLSLDLTGLPPSEEDLKSFMADNTSNAYENMVDKYLNNKTYGEKWAGMWLDLARYSDTNGYEKDAGRTIWRYRDEVIKAFNDDMPYDKFIINQLAGDMLPKATMQQNILTAFHRNTMNNTEGGTNDEEFRVAAVVDRVNTTWEALLGTSYGCVQCHTHPYDTFKHDEYYKFMAYLNNTADADTNNLSPTIQTPSDAELAKLEKMKADLKILDEKLKEEKSKVAPKAKKVQSYPLNFTYIKSTQGNTVKQVAPGTVLAKLNPKVLKDTYTLMAKSPINSLVSLQLDAIPHKSLNNSSSLSANFVISEIALTIKRGKQNIKVKFSKAQATYEQKSFPIKDSINGSNRDKGWAISGKNNVKTTAWLIVDKPVKIQKGDLLEIKIACESKWPSHVLGHFKVTLSTAAPQVLNGENGTSNLKKKRDQLANSIKKFKTTTTPVMQELTGKKRRKTNVFIRGSWEDKGEEVQEGTPAALNKFKKEWPQNRLGMAYWMTDPDNPLFARVAVNRFWEQLFGYGIVETLEDFGSQGIKPTHPELLNTLAWNFIHKDKWSIKSFLKTVVMSSTYRQSSNISKLLLKEDSRNHFLARGPRFRLSAEQLRDQALKVSGLLSSKMYGPSVMPYQPEGVWMTVYNGGKWNNSKGEDAHRRGLYTYWKRTSPYPSMETFDTPSREVCKVRRIRTNTPLQALVTLNDPVYTEAAAAFAKLILKNGGTSNDSRFQYAYKRALCRSIKAVELKTLKSLLADTKEKYKKSNEEAWAVVAGIIMNLDEFLTKK